MIKISPYLNFNGECENAMNFYQSVLGGEMTVMQKFNQVPAEAKMEMSDEDGNKIMHALLTIDTNSLIMASDRRPKMEDVMFGSNNQISLNIDDREKAQKIFQGLSEGGQVTMPFSEAFWNASFGMLIDKYGNYWMINCDHKS